MPYTTVELLAKKSLESEIHTRGPGFLEVLSAKQHTKSRIQRKKQKQKARSSLSVCNVAAGTHAACEARYGYSANVPTSEASRPSRTIAAWDSCSPG